MCRRQRQRCLPLKAAIVDHPSDISPERAQLHGDVGTVVDGLVQLIGEIEP